MTIKNEVKLQNWD